MPPPCSQNFLKDAGYSGKPHARNMISGCFRPQELLKPFLLACESKNAKLASIALVSFQKLLANDAVSDEGVPLIISGLEQVRRLLRIGLIMHRCCGCGTTAPPDMLLDSTR